jgi:hypothetical protein
MPKLRTQALSDYIDTILHEQKSDFYHTYRKLDVRHEIIYGQWRIHCHMYHDRAAISSTIGFDLYYTGRLIEILLKPLFIVIGGIARKVYSKLKRR